MFADLYAWLLCFGGFRSGLATVNCLLQHRTVAHPCPSKRCPRRLRLPFGHHEMPMWVLDDAWSPELHTAL